MVDTAEEKKTREREREERAPSTYNANKFTNHNILQEQKHNQPHELDDILYAWTHRHGGTCAQIGSGCTTIVLQGGTCPAGNLVNMESYNRPLLEKKIKTAIFPLLK